MKVLSKRLQKSYVLLKLLVFEKKFAIMVTYDFYTDRFS